MLYLSRKVGEAVVINHEVEVRVVDIRGGTVKLGFTFPAHASVLREEVHRQMSEANRAAAEGAKTLDTDLPDSGGSKEAKS